MARRDDGASRFRLPVLAIGRSGLRLAVYAASGRFSKSVSKNRSRCLRSRATGGRSVAFGTGTPDAQPKPSTTLTATGSSEALGRRVRPGGWTAASTSLLTMPSSALSNATSTLPSSVSSRSCRTCTSTRPARRSCLSPRRVSTSTRPPLPTASCSNGGGLRGQPIVSDQGTYDLGTGQQIKWGGGRYDVTWDSTRSESTNIFSTFHPSFGANMTLQIHATVCCAAFGPIRGARNWSSRASTGKSPPSTSRRPSSTRSLT